MPTSKNNSSSILRRGFKAEAERVAVQYRKELGLNEYAPLPAVQLAQHLGVRILIPSEIPGITDDILHLLLIKGKNCWSAAIYIRDNRKYIIHNPTHSAARQESNLMHELAHAHCNHELKELETALMNCIIPLRNYDPGQEAEAECLGACLQLPHKALFHYYHILKKGQDEIAKIFNASKEMVRYRMSMSGVLKIKYRSDK